MPLIFTKWIIKLCRQIFWQKFMMNLKMNNFTVHEISLVIFFHVTLNNKLQIALEDEFFFLFVCFRSWRIFIWYPKVNEILQCPRHHQVSVLERKPVENVTSEFVAIIYVTIFIS